MSNQNPALLEVKGVTKSFGSLRALENVSLTVPPGTFHAVIGENGAGKSTLAKCMLCIHPLNSGSVFADRKQITSPAEARSSGMGMVFQHFNLVPSLTVAENLLLARKDLPAILNWREQRAQLKKFLDTAPFFIDLDTQVAHLAAGQKQKVEILKQLYLKTKILILDEPTSVLTPAESDEVLTTLSAMVKKGDLSVVLISHRFREVMDYADEATILRAGKLVASLPVKSTNPAQLAELMMGASRVPQPMDKRDFKSTTLALEVDRLTVRGDNGLVAVNQVSLTIASGEILGIAGVSSNGLYEGPQAVLDTIDVIHTGVIPPVPSIGKIHSQTFEGTSWTSPVFVGSNASGTISAGAFGTINVLGSVTPSTGMRLDVNSTGSSNYWSGALNSGLIPISNNETNLGKLTLAFDLSSSAVRTIRVRLESADAGGVVSGALEQLIYPAGTNSFQRYTFELSGMTAASGTFSPTSPNFKLSFIMEGGIDAGSWSAGTNWLQVDNIYYARPAYYVKPTGSDSLNGQTEANAFLTISKALAVATNSGDIVLIMDGGISPSYAPPTAMLSFQGGGTPGGWVTFKNYPGQSPLIQANESNYDLFYISAGNPGASFDYTHSLNYIEVRGLRMRGTADTLATNLRGSSTPNSNVNGLAVSGRNMVKVPHHIRFADNEIYNFSAAGVAAIDSDWFFVENNNIHDNSFWTIYGTSGISSLTPGSFEGTAGTYRHYWLGNRSYHNQTNIKTASTASYSDGNGAIIDTWLTTRHGPYLGRILVANNQFYENGGSGIHALYVNGADIINNTVVRNSASTNLTYANIFGQSANDIVVANNIIVASTNELINGAYFTTTFPQTTGIKYLNNLYLSDGSTVAPYVGPNDSGNILTTDAKFVDAANDDYRLRTNSPAFDNALALPIVPVRDFYGVLRRTDGFADIGASERQPAIATPPAAQTNTVSDNVTFSVVAQSGGTNATLTYQWQLNGTNLVGATSNSLTLSNITVAMAGNYRAVVSVGTPMFDTVTSPAAALAVNKLTPTVAILPTTSPITYGQTLASSTLGSGSVTNTAGAMVPGGFIFTTSSILPNAGSTNVGVTFTPADMANYNTNNATVTVTVSQAPLGITANSTNKIYDGVAFTGGNGVVYSGFVNGETSAVLGGTLAYGGTSQGAIDGGTYSIVPSGLTNANYSISYTNGVLTILEPPQITAPVFSGGQFTFTLNGTTGSQYVVQATTNLNPANWISLTTNAVPFSFTDTNVSGAGQRFYRGQVAP